MFVDRTGRPMSSRSVMSAVRKYRHFAGASESAPLEPVEAKEFFELAPKLPDGTMACVLFNRDQLRPDALEFAKNEARLVEMVEYDDGLLHVYLIVRRGFHFGIKLARTPYPAPFKDLTVCAYFTDDAPYRDMLRPFVEHWSRACVRAHDADEMAALSRVRVCIAWYSDSSDSPIDGLDVAPDEVVVQHFPHKAFNEWHANSAVMRGGKYFGTSHMLKLDGDTTMSAAALRKLLHVYATYPSHGIVNIKEDEDTGPGLLFGATEQFAKNPWWDHWPAPFYHVDTEYLMNFSRVGIVPLTTFLGIERQDHDRPRHRGQGDNWAQLVEIIRHGRQR